MSIRMLSPEVIGKIAAGEVVERPSSAIKELVENSLDAGASMITVEIQDGGLTSMRVSDNGCGIQPSDVRLAFERHATSKISAAGDLFSVATLGFRGEALASIAAVSRVTLTTRTASTPTGLRVVNEGGVIQSITDAACAPGTTISAKDLFYNVPVRRDFMKKPAAEAAAVSDLMARFILSRPDVSFRYLSSGKTVYHAPGNGKIESALISIYGAKAFRSMRKVDGMEAGVLISGYVGIGESARGNRGGEYFFINGRMMRSPLLSAALEEACRERVMIGKFPVCALSLVMPYESVDVNVHPNKLEVRFRDDQAVRQALFRAVYNSLRDRDAFQRPVQMDLTGEKKNTFEDLTSPAQRIASSVREATSAASETAIVSADAALPAFPVAKVDVQPQGTVPDIELREKPLPVYRPVDPAHRSQISSPIPQPELLPPLMTSECVGSGQQPPLTISESIRKDQTLSAPESPGLSTTEHNDRNDRQHTIPTGSDSLLHHDGRFIEAPRGKRSDHFPAGAEYPAALPERAEQLSILLADQPRPMKVFGAVFNTFILIEFEDHLLLVDQHAVHERLLFDRMMNEVKSQRAGQEMLVPCVVSVTSRDLMLLEENRALLESVGLTVEPFGEHEVAVRSVPVILGMSETALFLREALDEIAAGKVPGEEKKRAAILQAACKHAVKGGEPLNEDILRSLVEEMIDKKVTPTCPHGRPLVVSISHVELDKKFRRIQ